MRKMINVKTASKKPLKKTIKSAVSKNTNKNTKKLMLKKSASKKKIVINKKRKFEFTKMVASGNDFIIFDNRKSGLKNGSEIALLLCTRTAGIGADGLIFIEKSKRADFKMRIFNPDGSEAEMCGNGIRCAALYKNKKNMKIETLAGILNAELNEDGIKVKMTTPLDMQLNINLNIDGRIHQVNYVNTGVPHSVCFVENLPAANVRMLGRLLRYHKHFEPVGTNVDFVKIAEHDSLSIRTYERGVEDETLACGTGSVAAALIYHHKFLYSDGSYCVDIKTRSDEVLKVYFDYEKGVFTNVWLEG
ncbi:MAG: diaminopimelate epimerase, partial [Candidatus Omnitrophica bacterium]|nr:diaminopimelate epimerase [Candidatus Omnitrophota bacterium]